jgi:hypothetical protein
MSELRTLVTPRILTVVQAFFLGRLERLLAIRRAQNPALELWQNALLPRAIYSTYRDCLDLGLANEVQALLHGEPSSPRPRTSSATG